MLKKCVPRLEYPLGPINIDLSLVYSMAIGGQTISTENYCQTTSGKVSKIFCQARRGILARPAGTADC